MMTHDPYLEIQMHYYISVMVTDLYYSMSLACLCGLPVVLPRLCHETGVPLLHSNLITWDITFIYMTRSDLGIRNAFASIGKL